MPLPELLRGNRWTEATARKILPLLVWCAKHGRTITYGKLDQEIVRRGWGHHVNFVQYGHPAGKIGDSLIETGGLWNTKIPPLNALIINANTGIPGDGCDYYLKHFLSRKHQSRKLNEAERKALAEATHDRIFNFRQWDELLEEFDLKPINRGLAVIEKPRKIARPVHAGWSSEGESALHKALKKFVAKNPKVLRLPDNLPKGDCEFVFASADRADVVFRTSSMFLAFEVKARISNDADLIRGIYQCVKYRALIRAEQKAKREVPSGFSMLVSERTLSDSLRNLASLLDVPVIIVHQSTMRGTPP